MHLKTNLQRIQNSESPASQAPSAPMSRAKHEPLLCAAFYTMQLRQGMQPSLRNFC